MPCLEDEEQQVDLGVAEGRACQHRKASGAKRGAPRSQEPLPKPDRAGCNIGLVARPSLAVLCEGCPGQAWPDLPMKLTGSEPRKKGVQGLLRLFTILEQLFCGAVQS